MFLIFQLANKAIDVVRKLTTSYGLNIIAIPKL